jgi:phosphoglycolate phosphatase
MKYRYLIFDLDGTLLDTSEGILKAIDYTICKLGLPNLSEEVKRTFIGPPIYESFARQYMFDKAGSEKATQIFRNVYKDKFLMEAVPYDGIYEMLRNLKQNGCGLAVATNKRDDYAQNLLNHFGFQNYFDYMEGSDFKNKKKKADIIRECIGHMNVMEINHVAMIGDTVQDYNGAYEVGIDFVGVKYGFGLNSSYDEDRISDCKLFNDVYGLERYLLE